MSVYTVKFKRMQEIATGTMAFFFEKPKDFVHTPGQFGDFTLINPEQTDAEGNIRAFSLASAPHEDFLMFATRMRDTAFKRVLKAMEPGAEFTMDAPHGSFTLHNNAQIPAVFLTGGIGVTPARSIILHAAYAKLPHTIYLFDSNNTPEDAAFLDELADAATTNHNYKFIGTMTNMEKSKRSWQGETGFITKAMLEKSISDLTLPIYYLAGPRLMVQAMRDILNKAGVNDDNIRTEEFSGY